MAFSAITVSQMISDCQFLLDDTSVPTSVQLLRSLNEARNQVFAESQSFTDDYSFSSLANVTKYTLPDYVYDTRDVRFSFGGQTAMVEPFTVKQYNDLGEYQKSPDTAVSRYYKQDRVLNLWPIPKAYDYTDTLASDLAAGAVSLTLTVGTEVLPTTGVVTIDGEQIYYGAKTDLTKTLSSLTRGFAGTTDADHSLGVTVHCPLSTCAYKDTLKVSISDTETGMLYLTTGTVKLPVSGRGIFGTEVMGWGGKDDASGTLQTLSRGLEGTTAASHTALDVFTHRDVIINYYRSPEDLTTANYLEVVLNPFYKVFEYFACWQAKIRDTDDINATGVNNQMNMFFSLYTVEKDKLIRYLRGRFDGLVGVDVRE